MPYTLVSAATLGFDLVRLPAGRDVAGVLLTGLGADAAYLRAVAAVHPVATGTPAQRSRWADRSRRLRGVADAGVPSLRVAGAGLDAQTRAAAVVSLLERATIGDAGALDRLVRDDVLGPESAGVADVAPAVRELAADLLSDAALAGWATAALPARERRALTAALSLAGPAPEPHLGPADAALRDLVARLGAATEPDRRRWQATVDEVRDGRRSWAAAMHGASWAAHVTGRTRALAAAQLLAARAFTDGGFTPGDGARGVWNAVAGVVQGVALGDLLDGPSLDLLSAPWELVHGSPPPGLPAGPPPGLPTRRDHPPG